MHACSPYSNCGHGLVACPGCSRCITRVRAAAAAGGQGPAGRTISLDESTARRAQSRRGPAVGWAAAGGRSAARHRHVHEQGLLQGSATVDGRCATGAATLPGRLPTCAAEEPARSTNDPRIGNKPPVSARWGDCKMDWPRENIVSPYPFRSAKDHYQALLADTKSTRGSHQAQLRNDAQVGRRVRRICA